MSVLERAKKSIGLKSGDDEPVLYFTDHKALHQWARDIDPVLEAGNNVLTLYESVSGFEIENMAQLTELCRNPEAFFKDQYYRANEKDFSVITKLKLDFKAMIPMPDNFGEVVKACMKFKSKFENKRQDFFTIENSQLILTDQYYQRRNKSCYLHASSAEEKQRLKVSEEIISSLKRIESVIPGEAIAGGRYAGPLPYAVRLVDGNTGPELSPNPTWVAEGLGGTNFTGRYFPTMKERHITRRPQELGPRYRRVYSVHRDGSPRHEDYYLELESNLKRVSGKLFASREAFFGHNLVISDEVYNRDGKPYGTPPEHTYTVNPKEQSAPKV